MKQMQLMKKRIKGEDVEERIGEETPASLKIFRRNEKGKEWERDSVRKKREKR
jgi:hypothetical protein